MAPSLAARESDTAEQYDCYIAEGREFSSCRYGSDDAAISIAITGDSHAASLIPGLRALVEARGWQLDTYVGFACQLAPGETCIARPDIERALVAGDYDMVLATGTSRLHPEVSILVDYWRALGARGVPIVPVVDVPYLPEDTNSCIDASGGVPESLESCRIPRGIALGEWPDLYGAAAMELGIPAIDLTPVLCDADTCSTIIGRTLVFRDSPASHLTATFSRTLADFWGAELDTVFGHS